MLKKYSLKALQIAINSAINLDFQMPEKLQALHGKVIELVITPLNVRFFIEFSHQKILLLDQYDALADTTIYSSPIGLIRLSLLPASKARSLFNDHIRMSGDPALGQQVKQIFDSMDIDWEGHLARFTGDVVAHQIGALVRQGKQFQQRFSDSMQQNMSEYLQEELRLSPSQEELNDFFNDVDAVSLAVERLEAHIHCLMSKNDELY